MEVKFKVGDKVKLIKHCCNKFEPCVGSIGEINAIGTFDALVKWSKDSKLINCGREIKRTGIYEFYIPMRCLKEV